MRAATARTASWSFCSQSSEWSISTIICIRSREPRVHRNTLGTWTRATCFHRCSSMKWFGTVDTMKTATRETVSRVILIQFQCGGPRYPIKSSRMNSTSMTASISLEGKQRLHCFLIDCHSRPANGFFFVELKIVRTAQPAFRSFSSCKVGEETSGNSYCRQDDKDQCSRMGYHGKHDKRFVSTGCDHAGHQCAKLNDPVKK